MNDHKPMDAQETARFWRERYDDAKDRADRLDALINQPQTEDFFRAVRTEAAHQMLRWVHDDKEKTDADWFWLIGYLGGKALHNPQSDLPPAERRLHRIISVAAAAYNWWQVARLKKESL